jgi:hypothetical protein
MNALFFCNQDLVETEYLKREFGLIPKLVDPNILQLDNKIVFIACTEPSNWTQILLNAQPKSIVFFLLGNETYDKKKYEFLNQFLSIRHVFIYNPPRQSSKFGLIALFDWIIRVPGDMKSKYLFFAWKFALEMRKKASSVEITYPWSNLPLGYTNQFVKQLPDLVISSGLSLVDNWPVLNITRNEERDRQVRFMGQIGTWYRKELVKYFSRFVEFEYVESSGWAGSSKSGYIEILQTSTFILCPPGIYTNETFRYYESIICGALPIAPINSLHDLHSSNYWSQILPFYAKHSHISLYRKLKKMSDVEISEYLSISRELFENEIRAVRSKLQELMCEKI